MFSNEKIMTCLSKHILVPREGAGTLKGPQSDVTDHSLQVSSMMMLWIFQETTCKMRGQLYNCHQNGNAAAMRKTSCYLCLFIHLFKSAL